MILKPLLLALFCAVLPLESRFERGHGKENMNEESEISTIEMSHDLIAS